MATGAGKAGVEPRPSRPAVTVRDEQDACPLDVERWRSLTSAVLDDLGVAADAEVSITFVAASAMTELNREHMGRDGTTDVLSFPIDGAPVGAGSAAGPPPMLGDVVICPEVAAANAPTHAGTYEDEMALLVVHGLLHLLGMDHAVPDDRAEMQARERELLDLYHGPLARDPWAD